MCFGAVYIFSQRFYLLKDYSTATYDHFSSDFIVLYRHAESRQYATFILNPEFFLGTATIPQSLIKVQSSGVFKELRNGDMSFANFHFLLLLAPLVFHTHS